MSALWAIQKVYEGTTPGGQVVRQRVQGPTGDRFELLAAFVHSMQMIADEENELLDPFFTRLISVELVRLNADLTRYVSAKPESDRDYGWV